MALALTATAVVPGQQGNLIQIAFVPVADASGVVLSVTESDFSQFIIHITAGYNAGTGNLNIGDWNAIAALMNSDGAVAALVLSVGTAETGVPAEGTTTLSGGSAGGGRGSYFFGLEAPVVAAVNPPPITSGIVPNIVRDYLRSTVWDCCLLDDIKIQLKVNFEPPSCPIPTANECNSCMAEGEEPPYDVRSQQSIQLKKFGIIATPAVAGDTQVLSFQVPVGYFGVIRSVVCMYTGTGFIPGDGDIIWRLQVSRRWVKDYGQILTPLGSLREPFPTQVYLVSGQFVRWYVNIQNLSGGIQPDTKIICAVNGWIYPMQERAQSSAARFGVAVRR